MTTEEKKCFVCGKSKGIMVFSKRFGFFHRDCSPCTCIDTTEGHNADCPLSYPPETGREWEVDMKIKIDDILTNILINTRKNKGNVDNVVYEKAVNKLVSLIRSIASSALAQGEAYKGKMKREWYSKGFAEGEKIGAEKEKDRIKKGLRAFNFNGVLMAGKYWIRLSDIRKKMNALIDAPKG